MLDLQRNLNTETVDHADPADPPCVEPTVAVREVLQLLKEHRTGCAVVCRDQVLVGIFTERDGLRLMADGADMDVPIEQVMVTRPVTLSASSTVGEAVAKMSSGGYRRMPLVDDDGRLVGLLKVSGILHYLVQHFPNVVYTLPPTPHHSTQQREGA